jgi:hypothetical protein
MRVAKGIKMEVGRCDVQRVQKYGYKLSTKRGLQKTRQVEIRNPSGCTAYYWVLTLKNATFCPHSVFMCFVWISEQTAIISLYSINWLVFTTEMECVYCAVRTECLNVIQFKFSLQSVTAP